jgi:hypothetical protein
MLASAAAQSRDHQFGAKTGGSATFSRPAGDHEVSWPQRGDPVEIVRAAGAWAARRTAFRPLCMVMST